CARHEAGTGAEYFDLW
nr:immunoglobulin heavy chain junction region [Macaca mulatta]